MIDEGLIEDNPFEYALSVGQAWLRANRKPMTISLMHPVEEGSRELLGYSFGGDAVAQEFRAVVEESMKQIFQYGTRGFEGDKGKVNPYFEGTVLRCLLDSATDALGYTKENVSDARNCSSAAVLGAFWDLYRFTPR